MTPLVWLLLSVGWCSAVPPNLFGGKAGGRDVHKGWKTPEVEPERVKTVEVSCHPNSLEITVKADMFEVGAPVYSDELRLGVDQQDYNCQAQASPGDEYTILVGLGECGTKHWVTEESLVYTNLLIFSPRVTQDGLIRMDEAVIPIECQYERKYSLSSGSLKPTWIPFMSTQAAVENLSFDMKLVSDDWNYERGSNVFHLGDLIPVEASVRVGHHLGLRVFVSSCTATLSPDALSHPRHVFIENGCFTDSQLPDSKSQFFPRIQDEKLHMVIDAFRFHNQDSGELYITCHLTAVPTNDPEAPHKACTFMNGRWRSADGNDYSCANCQTHGGAGHTGHMKPSTPAKFGPRGFGKPEKRWKSIAKTKMPWEQEAQAGPLVVLPAVRSGPLPAEVLPPVLSNIIKPYGSQWRSGIRVDQPKALLPDPPSPDQDEDQTSEEESSGDGIKNGGTKGAPETESAPMGGAADLSDVVQMPSAMTPSNETMPEHSDIHELTQ
ncbi:zona pellucida sperm-binding protein 3-like [Takifugu flavidus]|uniref:zona pellucida sperm-binding protein 3-like n=1 Tax=Takifugu flavidus TaxID=433684 RepID=UPI002544CCE1|nr:zona pellucida sperm-binding protein 3-like [Takifugu flavidus]